MLAKTKNHLPKLFSTANNPFEYDRIDNFRRASNQAGFIPMLIALAIIIVAIIWFVFSRVINAN